MAPAAWVALGAVIRALYWWAAYNARSCNLRLIMIGAGCQNVTYWRNVFWDQLRLLISLHFPRPLLTHFDVTLGLLDNQACDIRSLCFRFNKTSFNKTLIPAFITDGTPLSSFDLSSFDTYSSVGSSKSCQTWASQHLHDVFDWLYGTQKGVGQIDILIVYNYDHIFWASWRPFLATPLEAEAGWMSNQRYARTLKGKMNYTKQTKEDFHESCELGWSSLWDSFLDKIDQLILKCFQDIPSIDVWLTYTSSRT